MEKQAKITNKDQITAILDSDEKGTRIQPARAESPFGKYRGIGNPGIRYGRSGIIQWLRKMRSD